MMQMLLNQLSSSASTNSIGWTTDQTYSTCDESIKYTKFFWSKGIGNTESTAKNFRRTTSRDPIS
jgi:hypothetical protein